MQPLGGSWITHSQRRGLALIVLAMLAALSMAAAATAQAAPNVAVAWGANNEGQLGDGSTVGPEDCRGSSISEEHTACSTFPVAVSGLTGVTAIAGGGGTSTASGHSLALLENGTVAAWGENGGGQLGNGTTTSSDLPASVCAVGETAPCVNHLEGVKAISAAGGHSMALLASGAVVEWGEVSTGGESRVPVEVSGLSGVTAIAAGGEFSLAVVTGGKVMAWGNVGGGKLGDGTETGSTVPVPVCAVGASSGCLEDGPYLEGATAVAASAVHSLALLSNGTIAAWGRNFEGELGDGTETASDVPVAVSGLSGVTAISAGGRGGNGGQPFSLALVSNGTVEAWGTNEEGELGDGTFMGPETCSALKTGCAKVPTPVSGLSGVTAITAHGKHSLALLKGGSVMTWGGNEFGTLGIGTSNGPEVCFFGGSEGGCSTKPVAALTHGAMLGLGAGDADSYAFGPPPPPPTNLPELGRCRKLTTKTGAYGGTSNVCLRLSKTHTGYFEWMPGPGSNRTFKETLSSPKLETAGKKKFSCTLMFVKGEYTGAKTETVTSVVLEGCEEAFHHQNCSSGPSSGTNLESAPGTEFEGELGFIVGGEKPQVGWDLKPKSPASSFFSFTCGPTSTSSEVLTLEGSVIGRALPIDKMVSGFGLRYGQSGGVQLPERFEGGVKDTLLLKTALPGPPPSESSEQIGVKTEGSVEDGEELEIKAKV